MYLQKGYVAISSVLVIAVVILVISTGVALMSINEIQSALSNKQGGAAHSAIEGCAEDALLRIGNDDALPSSISTPEVNCSVTINSHIGNDWIVTLSGTVGGYYKQIQVSATRGSSVSVSGWIES